MTRGNDITLHQWEIQIQYQETFTHKKSGKTLAQAAQGGGGVTVPGDVQETCGCGTEGHGLARTIGEGRMVGLDDPVGLFQR